MRRMVLLFLAVGLGLMMFAQSAAAATKTPLTFTDTVASPGTPERTWVSGDVLHMRGQPQTTVAAGDITGGFRLDVNLNVDLVTGRGELFGKFALITATVTWEGSFAASITPEGVSGTFVGHGTDGTKIMGTFTSTGPATFLNEAVILDPHG
jgi:hypothetical protein